jgi:S-adenosylmethionine-diacylglycerol 3-amino-3-carboxypropyl transferase
VSLPDRAFQSVFSRLFVYNVLFEDAEVDERYLGVGEDSSVLSITGAGCGVAGLLSRNPRRIDAVDINPHHLALTALKVTAARHVDCYGTFYDLLGRGWHPSGDRVVERLMPHYPEQLARLGAQHGRRTRKGLYRTGVTSRMLGALRRRLGSDAAWVQRVSTMPLEQRRMAVRQLVEPVRRSRVARTVLRSPVQLLALGVNFTQRDRIVQTEGQDMVEFFVTYLERAIGTDLATNWFVWLAAAGHFNHEHPDAVPPYLRRDRWARSREATTEVAFHHRNLFDVLAAAGPGTWSHYTLCDAVDWMPLPVQQRLFAEIRRTARPGATVLMRTVEDHDVVGAAGADRFLTRMPCSDAAAGEDRTRQYRRVDFYQVAA